MPYFAPYVYREYPKWLRRDGYDDVLVEDAEAEAAQLAAWGDEQPKPAPSPVTENKLLAPVVVPVNADEPKRKGGWPKGKKRGAPAVTVN